MHVANGNRSHDPSTVLALRLTAWLMLRHEKYFLMPESVRRNEMSTCDSSFV